MACLIFWVFAGGCDVPEDQRPRDVPDDPNTAQATKTGLPVGTTEVGLHDRADVTTRAAAAALAPARAEVIALAEADADLLPVLAPLCAKIGGSSRPAALVVVREDAPGRAFPPVGLVPVRGRYAVRRATTPGSGLTWAEKEAVPIVLTENDTRTALEIAGRYWPEEGQAILASTSDTSASIQAACLAAHTGAAFIPVILGGRDESVNAVRKRLPNWTFLFVGTVADAAVLSASMPGANLEAVTATEARHRVIRRVGPEKVRNIIVARAPDSAGNPSRLAWLAPHLSLVRGAPVVLCQTGEPDEVEELVDGLVRGHRLRPRSVTLLGDYTVIRPRMVSDQNLLGEYQVTVEPCSGGVGHSAAALGTGRIPCTSLSQASVLLAAGQIRERLAPAIPQVLLIANPNSQYGALPLAETMARLKAEELRNAGVGVMPHFGLLPAMELLKGEAVKATVVLYEGHIVDEPMFRARVLESLPPSGAVADWGVSQEPVRPGQDVVPIEGMDMWGEPCPPAEPSAWVRALQDLVPDDQPPGRGRPPDVVDVPTIPSAPDVELRNLALVVLQSCHSLNESTLRNIVQAGGCGLVGTVTSVHSASGSAIMKTFLDAAVHQDATVGEALRDARNYFLCLALLKAQRGHKELAKVRRVALTFHLWGDPEMRVFGSRTVGQAKRDAVSARFAGYGTIAVRVPRRRLPEARTEQYTARVFPGSQVAGIVRRVKDKEYRRLAPTYYFRLPVSESFRKQLYSELHPDAEAGGHAVFLTDSEKWHVHVLYFPEKESPGASFRLRFR